MAKVETIKCPECGAPLHFESEQEYCFCSHCGHQVYKEDVHYDKNMELKLKKLENEDKQDKRDTMLLGLVMVVVALVVVSFLIFVLLAK